MLPFREAWLCDFEFRADPGERPWPLCMVARELLSGRELRLWREDLLALPAAPFDAGPDSVFVAYFASAELGCFLALGWPPPVNVLDLYVEHRAAMNGTPAVCGDSLVGALAARGLAHIDAGEKEAMRRLILDQTSWVEAEQEAILDYCASDVHALAALLPRMAPSLDWPRALLRGRYMVAVARMEHAGTPVDAPLHRHLVARWADIRQRLVAEVDAEFGVYDGQTFKADRFAAMLAARGIPWPRLPSGSLALDDDTFRQQSKLYPAIGPLHELRATMGELRLTGLQVGADGRNRCLLSPFRAVTGRNQPSNTRFIFGPARWMRGLIRPEPGCGLAYLDFSGQEIAIAAGLSGDEALMRAYASGDPYLAFAKAAGLAPENATGATHKVVRDRCKAVVLGINYGMAEDSLAASIGIAPIEARELLRLHRQTYPRFWRWSEGMVTGAMLTNQMQTVFGWRRRLDGDANPRALANFPMQGNGAEMMRIAAIAATEAGLEVCCPIHDAFLIAAPLDRLGQDVTHMQELMGKAGRAVTGGFDVRTEAEVVRWPDRYMDPRGQRMWERITAMVEPMQEAA